jgi:putative molybdopterin biosynthesis protein
VRLQLNAESIATGQVPQQSVATGTATSLATGGMIPRGADAVLMIEHADVRGNTLTVRKALAPGAGVSFAGTDITAGETVVRSGEVLTSRETGGLAAIGTTHVQVYRRPRVAIISTGDEIIAPGTPMQPGKVYDSNAQILADSIRELGGEPLRMGIVPDDLELLRDKLADGLEQADVVLLSGGTSKGEGDLCYRVLAERTDPGIVAHGIALKPGKPLCLAATQGKPVVILPGFPTSAIFTFSEFVAPILLELGGRKPDAQTTITAKLAVRVNSEVGRTEYLLVGLVSAGAASNNLVAYPMGKGSGSVTTFSRADGFVTIDRHQEIVEAGTPVEVRLLGREVKPPDLVVIGSHCVGLDYLLGRVQQCGFRIKFLAVGSTAGLDAAQRGECDLAGIHLLDAATGEYNRPFLTPNLALIAGYGRLQGIVYRPDDARFAKVSPDKFVEFLQQYSQLLMVSRNPGSGTRVLIDRLLGGQKPAGYANQPRNHNAVAAAVRQGRADWGVTIETVAKQAELGFLPIQHEQYDFVSPINRDSHALTAFCQELQNPTTIAHLQQLGFSP